MSCPFLQQRATNTEKPVTYKGYLELDKILSAQNVKIRDGHKIFHDEHLFIIIHQAFELWFKQVIFEIDSVRDIFLEDFNVDDGNMRLINARMSRVVRIMKLVVEQFMIIETMSPLDFLDFRGSLGNASGFQSLQFRQLEIKYGIKSNNRQKNENRDYKEYLSEDEELEKLESETESEKKSFFDLINRWLEYIFDNQCADIWKEFENISYKKYKEENENEAKKKEIKFDSLFAQNTSDSESEETVKKNLDLQGFSPKAIRGALMVTYHRDKACFNQPYQLLGIILDIDSFFMKWRYHHVLMVQKMIGNNPGTAGTSGYGYLRSTVDIGENYKVFVDLYNLSTFLIPRKYIQ